MNIRVIAFGEEAPFGVANFDNDVDANYFLESVSPTRELTKEEITEAFGDWPHYAGDENTTQTGTTLENVTFSRQQHYTLEEFNLESNSKYIREERDRRLLPAFNAISKYEREQKTIASGINVTNPMSENDYLDVLSYAQTLCDIPDVEGFPWNGVGDVVWPDKPSVVKDNPVT